MLTQNHELLTAEVKRHIEADAIVAGHYWNEEEFTGCFIGCLTHSDDAQEVTELFGLPLPLVKVCENIFENLPAEDGRAFFSAIPDAVGHDGKDLSLVHWRFFAAELRALPAQPSHIQDVIDPVIQGMDLLSSGVDWDAGAARAAADAAAGAARVARVARVARAARAAYAAARAAYAAARAAADTAYAARAAAGAADTADAADAAYARVRQRDTILRLISEAK